MYNIEALDIHALKLHIAKGGLLAEIMQRARTSLEPDNALYIAYSYLSYFYDRDFPIPIHVQALLRVIENLHTISRRKISIEQFIGQAETRLNQATWCHQDVRSYVHELKENIIGSAEVQNDVKMHLLPFLQKLEHHLFLDQAFIL